MPIQSTGEQSVQADWIKESGVNLVFGKEGKQFAIATEYRQHNMGWQAWQGIQALFLTIFTFGQANGLRSKWEQAWTGKENHYIVDRWPPATTASTTEKIQNISTTLLLPLDKDQEQKLEILLFIDRFREKATHPWELQDKLNNALAIEKHIQDPKDRKTLLDIGETIADEYAKLGKHSKAQELREETARKLSIEVSPEKRQTLEFLDKLKKHGDSFSLVDLVLHYPTALQAAKEITRPEDRQLLLDVAEKIALSYVADGEFLRATNFRIEVAKAFKDEPEIDNIKIRAFIEQYHSEKFDALYETGPLIASDTGYQRALLEEHLDLVNPKTGQQEKDELLKISEEIASKFDAEKKFDTATAIRLKAAKALLPAIPLDHVNEMEVIARMAYAPETLSPDQFGSALKLLDSDRSKPPTMENRKMLLNLSETVAQRYLSENNTKMAFEAYMQALKLYFAEPKTIQSGDVGFALAQLYGKALELGKKLGDPASKTALYETTELFADEWVKLDSLGLASAIRLSTALSITPAPPLGDLKARLANEDPKLGLKIYPIDTTLFKNHTLSLQRRTFAKGETRIHLEAKLGHPTRDKLQKTVDLIKANPAALHKFLPAGFCTGIKIEQQQAHYLGREEKSGKPFEGDFSDDVSDGYQVLATEGTHNYPAAEDIVIRFEGVGSIKIGASTPELYHSLYNRISIDLEPHITEEEAVSKLMVLLAAMGLEAAGSSPRPVDEERIKILQLFHLLYPREAYEIERDERLLGGSLETLKSAIVKKVPDMKAKFITYLEDHPDWMYKQEVYSGQPVWAVKGIAEEVKKEGGWGLMAGVSGQTFEGAVTSFASMLKHGALSTHDRFEHGIIVGGASSGEDLRTGGGEYVFTRLIMDTMEKDPSKYMLEGKFQILYDLDLIERAGLIYEYDKYGSKESSSYTGIERHSAVGLAKAIKGNPWETYKRNEVCLKKRVPPQYMKGVMVADDVKKLQMIQLLRAEGLVTLNSSGVECINGKPIDQFIHVGEMKKEYWT